MTSPNSGTGYDKSDCEKGGNGYMPISLQYNDYTATYARNPSLAGARRAPTLPSPLNWNR